MPDGPQPKSKAKATFPAVPMAAYRYSGLTESLSHVLQKPYRLAGYCFEARGQRATGRSLALWHCESALRHARVHHEACRFRQRKKTPRECL